MHFLKKKLYQKEDNLHMQYVAHVEETFFNVKEATRFIWTIIQMGKKEPTLM